jgi:hypothetical protein
MVDVLNLLAQDLPDNGGVSLHSLAAAAVSGRPPQCPLDHLLANVLLEASLSYVTSSDSSSSSSAQLCSLSQTCLEAYLPLLPSEVVSLPALLGIVTSAAVMQLTLSPDVGLKLSVLVQKHLSKTQDPGDICLLIWAVSQQQQVWQLG